MKRVYKGMYKMTRSESVGVFAITLAVVAVYSFWGAYVLHTQNPSVSSQSVSVDR